MPLSLSKPLRVVLLTAIVSICWQAALKLTAEAFWLAPSPAGNEFRRTSRALASGLGNTEDLSWNKVEKIISIPDVVPIPKSRDHAHHNMNGSYIYESVWDQQLLGEFDQQLRSKVNLLGQLLGTNIMKENKDTFDAVEKLIELGREWRLKESKDVFDEIVNTVKNYDVQTLGGISRAFTHFLALSNTAESYNRVRRLRSLSTDSGFKSQSGEYSAADSFPGSIDLLKNDLQIPVDVIYDALCQQSVEIVLTAHPTEVNRRTMLQKHASIMALLNQLDSLDLTAYEKREAMRELQAQIGSIWQSDDLRRTKPSPVDEANSGLAIVGNILWHAVPGFLRKVDDVMRTKLGKDKGLPVDSKLIKVASWMGGDRDGNPNVTPEITLQVSMQARKLAAVLFKADIGRLFEELSLCTASAELLASTNSTREPYRKLLYDLEQRLEATIQWADAMANGRTYTPMATMAAEPLMKIKELQDPLMLVYRSLVSTDNLEIADGLLTDILRRVASFGLVLTPLDIRQESSRHSEALDAITRYLGIGSYLQWDEPTRCNWLQSELASKRPLVSRQFHWTELGFSENVIDTLRTFEVIAQLGHESLGAYVISQCQQTSDVLAVSLLQKDAGVDPPLRVVPLFETLDDLERAASTVDTLFSSYAYRGRINNKQEIMVGYSDSAKDAGRLAASWAQYKAQVSMMEIAKRHGVDVSFFHGKGGTVGRGGNPAVYKAILAHPPKTINGRFRVTEQGEMITQNLGNAGIAERTLDLFTSGVLTERFLKRPEPKAEWLDMMERLSVTSCADYRQVVRREPRFVPYFRSATPELELAGLNVGSRPAKRNPTGGVESLRAIPWVFAWTQTRFNLPTWLGVGSALSKELEHNSVLLKNMYKDWPWFQTLVDLLEMILVKSEATIAENYDRQLVSDPKSIKLGQELREKLRQTTASVLQVSGNPQLQANNPTLLRSLAVRNPYIDPLNIIQAELLKRSREAALTDDERSVLQDALLITIKGIANGMRNSG